MTSKPGETKQDFEAALQAELQARYTWAQDEGKLARFMRSVSNTLRDQPGNQWQFSGPAATAAWRLLNLKGRITLHALRQLPEAADAEEGDKPDGA